MTTPDKTVEMKPLSDLSMMTFLLQALAVVNSKYNDPSLYNYVESQQYGPLQEMPEKKSYEPSTEETEANFTLLNSISDILVRNDEVLAASYHDTSQITLLTPSPYSESDSESDKLNHDTIDIRFPPPESIAAATRLFNAAVIPNANDRRESGGRLSGILGEIWEIERGQSLWPVSENIDDALNDVVNIDCSHLKGLANHAESVATYLYEYGRTQDKVLRNKYSRSFFRYLLAASWKKLHFRFCSWQALGFIETIGKTFELVSTHVKEIGNIYGPDELPQDLGPGDHTLADFFRQNKRFILKMMAHTYSTLPDSTRLPLSEVLHFQSDSQNELFNEISLKLKPFSEAVELALGQRNALYRKETAISFHLLLYLAFLMTGKALRNIKDKNTDLTSRKVELSSYKSSILAAELPFRFLICILSSKAFRLHMKVWTNEGGSLNAILPVYQKKGAYKAFGKDHDILAKLKQGPPPENFEGDIIEIPDTSKTLVSFNRWITIFVAHFLAKRTLEVHSTKIFQNSLGSFQKPKFRILAVKSDEYLVPPWDEFKRVIREALKGYTEEHVDNVSSVLQQKVREKVDMRVHSVQLFWEIMNGKKESVILRMHCEAVFAALLEARERVDSNSPEDADLNDLKGLSNFYKTLQDDMISVSKLCCPVCWELFKVLKLGTKILGCHPTVTPLALPDTLSHDIAEQVVNALRPQLANQLAQLMDAKKPRNTHHRNESETGHSAASSNEGAGTFKGSYEAWENENLV